MNSVPRTDMYPRRAGTLAAILAITLLVTVTAMSAEREDSLEQYDYTPAAEPAAPREEAKALPVDESETTDRTGGTHTIKDDTEDAAPKTRAAFEEDVRAGLY